MAGADDRWGPTWNFQCWCPGATFTEYTMPDSVAAWIAPPLTTRPLAVELEGVTAARPAGALPPLLIACRGLPGLRSGRDVDGVDVVVLAPDVGYAIGHTGIGKHGIAGRERPCRCLAGSLAGAYARHRR